MEKEEAFIARRVSVVIRTTGRVIHHTSRLVHRLMVAATGLVVIVSVLLAVAAWRLSQGPIELVWLSNRAKAILSDDTAPVRVSFNSVMLAWEGFQKGVDYPLDLRITDIDITDPMGKRLVSAPEAHLTLSAAALLLGRFVPAPSKWTRRTSPSPAARTEPSASAAAWPAMAERAIARWADHRISARCVTSLPIRSARIMRNRDLLDQIQRVHFRDAALTVTDQTSGLILQSTGVNLDLRRPGNGHIVGTLNAPLSAGSEQAVLTAHIDLVPDGDTRVDVTLSPFHPAGINAVPSALAATAPVSLTGTVALDHDFDVRQGTATLHVGAGVIPAAKGVFPLQDGIVEISGTSSSLTIRKAHFNLARQPQDAPQTLDISGTLIHTADRLVASATVAVDQIDIADLPRLWPVGVANAARSWVAQNVTAGTVRHGAVDVVIEADDALNHVVVTRATGDLDGSNATFTWLDNVPPVEQTEVHLQLVDPDTLDILVPSGRQRIRNGGGDLLLKDGRLRITGLTAKDQFADISTRVEGSVSSTWTLLKEPRLHLLSAHPIGLKTVGGDVAAALTFQFPLNADLQIDDVTLHADAHVRRVRLLDIVHGHSLDDGAFDLDITRDGLALKGRAPWRRSRWW